MTQLSWFSAYLSAPWTSPTSPPLLLSPYFQFPPRGWPWASDYTLNAPGFGYHLYAAELKLLRFLLRYPITPDPTRSTYSHDLLCPQCPFLDCSIPVSSPLIYCLHHPWLTLLFPLSLHLLAAVHRSVVSDSAFPRTGARQAPLSMEFSRQPVPSPGDLLDPGIKPGSPALQVGFSPFEPPGKP